MDNNATQNYYEDWNAGEHTQKFKNECWYLSFSVWYFT